MQYLQITLHPISAEQSDMLIAQLSEIGFEGFEEGEQTLHAFIPMDKYDTEVLNDTLSPHQLNFSSNIIEETNWNKEWESSFSPVIVDDFVAVRAHFHEPIHSVEHEIVITPKMSFGTGHHATTFMMMQQMREINFNGQSVLDFGTGTGILAILAEKMGSTNILAIDNDNWCIDNANENLARNNCTAVDLRKLDSPVGTGQFDVILANINKHIILENLPVLAGQLNIGGTLLLSGLLSGDQTEIEEACQTQGLALAEKGERHNWLSLKFSKT